MASVVAPGEKQVAVTEPSGVRMTSPLTADPRGFSGRLPALGRLSCQIHPANSFRSQSEHAITGG